MMHKAAPFASVIRRMPCRASSLSVAAVHVVGLTACAVSLAGCVGVGSTISVRELEVMPPSMMVAQKSGVPLNLILDPSKVQPTMPVVVANEHRGASVADLNLFVERDLKRALENYFSWVEIVSPEVARAKQGIDAEVRIDRVEIVVFARGLGYAELTWSIGLREKGAAEYLFAFAGKSKSEPTTDPKFALRSAFESAITDFVKAYTDKEVQQAVLGLTASAG